MSGRPSAAQLLECPGALLTRSDLAELGLTRTMIDAVFRACPVVVFPGSRRGAIRREDYLDLLDRCTTATTGSGQRDRVQSTAASKGRPDRAAGTAPAGTRPRPTQEVTIVQSTVDRGARA